MHLHINAKRTFCPWGHFVRGHFVMGTFCHGDILSWGHFVRGHFVMGTFCPDKTSPLGYIGKRGHFV